MGEPAAAGLLVTLLPVQSNRGGVGMKERLSRSLDSQRTRVTFIWLKAGGAEPEEGRGLGNLKFPGDERKETCLLQRHRVREVRWESSRKSVSQTQEKRAFQVVTVLPGAGEVWR